MADYFPPPRDLPNRRAWAYLRDSGGPAQENSVTQQENELRAYCEHHNLMLVEIFRDVAKSGGSVDERKDFERMIDTSKNESLRPGILLVWNSARFSRDENDAKFYRALLRKRGIAIHSLTDPIPADEFGGVIEALIDFSNAEKRRQNSRDVKRGLKQLIEEGFAPGTPPVGYIRSLVQRGVNRDGKERMVSKWVRDPALWDSVIKAWVMRAEGKSYKEIQEATGLYKSLPCYHGFFKNKVYLGIYSHGGIEYPDHHEPATTWEIWEAVQKLRKVHPMQKNNPRHARRVGNPSLLTGFTYCAECDSMMTHSPGHKVKPWAFYICGRKDRHGAKSCQSRRIGAKHAEDAIVNAVIEKVLSPAYLEEVIENARLQFGDTSDIERQIKKVKHDLESLDIAIQRALNAIERTGSEAAYKRHEQRERERAQVKDKLDHLEAQLAAAKVEITPEAMTIVLDEWSNQLTQARATNDVKLIRTWLQRFVSRVELGYQQAKIFYTYPLIDFSPLDNSRKFYPVFGGISLKGEKPIIIEWRTR